MVMKFLIIIEKHQMQKDFGQTLQRHNGGFLVVYY